MPTRKIISAFCLLLSAFLSACITITPRTRKASSAATVIPNIPMQKWDVMSCGAGSLSTVLQHYGDTTPMSAWDASLPKVRGGVMSVDLLLAARQKGFDAQLVTGTPDTVAAELTAGRPVILMLQVVDYMGKKYDFFHYIVADGIDPQRGLIRTQWGDQKGRWTTFAKLEKPWSGGGHAAILIKPRDAMEESLRAAVALEESGDYGKAASSYRALLAAHPDSLVAWTNLGNAEMQLGNNVEAEEAFRKALTIDGSSRDALNNLAWLLLQQKKLAEAESLARKAAAQPGPDKYLIMDTLARVLAAKGDCGEAASTFRQAIDGVPAARGEARAQIETAMREAAANCGH